MSRKGTVEIGRSSRLDSRDNGAQPRRQATKDGGSVRGSVHSNTNSQTSQYQVSSSIVKNVASKRDSIASKRDGISVTSKRDSVSSKRDGVSVTLKRDSVTSKRVGVSVTSKRDGITSKSRPATTDPSSIEKRKNVTRPSTSPTFTDTGSVKSDISHPTATELGGTRSDTNNEVSRPATGNIYSNMHHDQSGGSINLPGGVSQQRDRHADGDAKFTTDITKNMDRPNSVRSTVQDEAIDRGSLDEQRSQLLDDVKDNRSLRDVQQRLSSQTHKYSVCSDDMNLPSETDLPLGDSQAPEIDSAFKHHHISEIAGDKKEENELSYEGTDMMDLASARKVIGALYGENKNLRDVVSAYEGRRNHLADGSRQRKISPPNESRLSSAPLLKTRQKLSKSSANKVEAKPVYDDGPRPNTIAGKERPLKILTSAIKGRTHSDAAEVDRLKAKEEKYRRMNEELEAKTSELVREAEELLKGSLGIISDLEKSSDDISNEISNVGSDLVNVSQEEANLNQGKANLSQEETTLSRGEANLSQGEATLSRGEATLSQEEATLSQEEATLSQEGATLSREGATLSREGATLSRVGATLSREGAALSRGEATLSRGKATLSRGEENLSQDEANLSQGDEAMDQSLTDHVTFESRGTKENMVATKKEKEVRRSRTSIGSRKSLSSKRPSTGLEQKPKTETYQQNINSLLKTSPRISGLDKNLLASIKRMEANEGLGSIGGLGPNLRKFAKSCDVPYGVEDIGSEAMIRLLKAKLKVMQEEIDHLYQENNRKEKAIITSEAKIKELYSDKVRLQINYQNSFQLVNKFKQSTEELKKKNLGIERAHMMLRKEIDALHLNRKREHSQHCAVEVRLNRALEELEKYKTELKMAEITSKEVGKHSRNKVESLMLTNQQLEKRNTELMSAFKKQMKLVEILKQQKMHIEAATVLSFAEDEFMKALDWDYK